jgi:hypothetical protein
VIKRDNLHIRVLNGVIIATVVMVLASAGCVTVNVSVPGTESPIGLQASGNVTADFPPAAGNSSDNRDDISGTGASAASISTVRTVAVAARVTANPNSKSDVNRRFQDVVFGNEAQYLNRWENRYVKLGIAGEYTPEDVETIRNFVNRFNIVSETTRLTQPYESESQEFTIYIVPPSYFATMDENKADKIARNELTGEIYFADITNNNSWVEKDTIYINSRFTGEERKYLVLRGLLYDLGFEGYSDDPTSIFYFDPRTTELSDMDWAVINLLYSKKFAYGESLSSVRSKLN